MPRPPDSDWFPSRVDLRRVRRIDRSLFAVVLNGLFLTWALGAGPLRGGTYSGSWAMIAFAVTAIAAVILSWLSKNRYAFRRFAQEQGRALGLTGQFVEVRYFRGELELGRDMGWLGHDAEALRFEGARTHFLIAQTYLVTFPDASVRPCEFVVDVNGTPVTVAVKATGETYNDVVELLRQWPTHGTSKHTPRMPPTTPAARSRGWYWQRVLEEVPYAGGFIGLSLLLQNLVPRSIPWLRAVVFFSPFAIFAIYVVLRVRSLRRRDQELLTATFSAPFETTPLEGGLAGAEEVRHVTA